MAKTVPRVKNPPTKGKRTRPTKSLKQPRHLQQTSSSAPANGGPGPSTTKSRSQKRNRDEREREVGGDKRKATKRRRKCDSEDDDEEEDVERPVKRRAGKRKRVEDSDEEYAGDGRNGDEDGSDEERGPRGSKKPFSHLRRHKIPSGKATKRWRQLNAPSLAALKDLLDEIVVESLAPIADAKSKAVAQRTLQRLIPRIHESLATLNIPQPVSEVLEKDGSLIVNLDELSDRITAKEMALEPEIQAVADLEFELDAQRSALESENLDLKNFERKRKAVEAEERSDERKKVHPLLRPMSERWRNAREKGHAGRDGSEEVERGTGGDGTALDDADDGEERDDDDEDEDEDDDVRVDIWRRDPREWLSVPTPAEFYRDGQVQEGDDEVDEMEEGAGYQPSQDTFLRKLSETLNPSLLEINNHTKDIPRIVHRVLESNSLVHAVL